MGVFNFTRGGFTGSVGVHTGRNWKGKNVLSPKTAPAYSRTEKQAEVRDGFGRFTKFVALFAPEIKLMTSWATSKMSVRNAIIQANKANITAPAFGFESLVINKGGRQKPINFTATSAAGIITATWSKPTSTVYTSNAKLVIVAVDEQDAIVEVAEVSPNAETWTGTINFGTNSDVYVYGYYIDKVGSARVGSLSVGVKVAGA